MHDQVKDALLGLLAQHGYGEDQFDEFLKKEVRETGSIITAEFKNGIAKFAVVKPEELKIAGEVDRVNWDFNRALEIEHILDMKSDFNRIHGGVDTKWIYSAEGSAAAYYPRNNPRKIKRRKLRASNNGGEQINTTHFRKNNNSRRGW
jgi:hypothetical protein